MMLKSIISAIACCIAGSVNAATITASSVTWTDVSNAVETASVGDTVQIPAGRAIWTAQLTVGKAINLIGAGTNSTVIVYSNKMIMLFSGIASNLGFRMSSIAFSNSATALFNPPQCPVTVNGPLLTFRIDRCLFHKGQSPIRGNLQLEGVIDHNYFVNCESGIYLVGDGTNKSWIRPIVTGTTNTTCIENNWFYLDDNFSGPQASHNQDIYQQDGARSTARYNVWDHNGYSGYDSFYDSHGLWVNGQAQPLCEFYFNLITNGIANNWSGGTDSRGGSALWWSNTFVLSTVLNQTYLLDLREEAVKGYTGAWPSPQQVSNTFLWGNTFNGAIVTNAFVNDDSIQGNMILQNRDYWMSVPNSTNGLPLGVYAGYSPLVYPHPLVTAQDGPSSAIAKSQTSGRVSFSGKVSQ